MQNTWQENIKNNLTSAKECNNFFKTTIFNDKVKIKIPIDFASLIDKNNKNDPLLRQIFINQELSLDSFAIEPLGDSQNIKVAGLIHKYKNRALIITTKSCAIFCQYCFRQNFPYSGNDYLQNWQEIQKYLSNNTQINEVILSGGDPLNLADKKLKDLIKNIQKIKNIKTIRIHSRTLSIIKNRINDKLIELINNATIKIVLVTHINHPNEISKDFADDLKKLNCLILNQSVLLKGVNDNSNTLIELSNKLWGAGILPYYLHLLDKVNGSEDYLITDDKARKIYKNIQKNLSGYLVPKLVRDENKTEKTILT